MAFDVLTIVYHNFSQRIPTTIELLQKSLPVVRPLHIEEIVDLLVSGNLLQQNADDTDMVIPVTSAEQLSGSEVVGSWPRRLCAQQQTACTVTCLPRCGRQWAIIRTGRTENSLLLVKSGWGWLGQEPAAGQDCAGRTRLLPRVRFVG